MSDDMMLLVSYEMKWANVSLSLDRKKQSRSSLRLVRL